MTVTIDIYTPNHTAGLRHDHSVLAAAIGTAFGDRVAVRRIGVPLGYLGRAKPDDPFPKRLGKVGDIAIFIERAFHADFVRGYRHTAMLINPEWFGESDRAACETLGHTIVHKSRHYHATLAPVLAGLDHVHTGFTSVDPRVSVSNWISFSHFRGLSRLRLTQPLIDLWRRNPGFPLLRVQAYGNDIAIETQGWVGAGNLQFYFGKLERAAYLLELTRGGIKLCTTRVEGYGHFVNEARAMSALTIALDAPPMNELITAETGVLVPVCDAQPQRYGTVYDVAPQDLLAAIDRVLAMPVPERARIGRAARVAYERDDRDFQAAFDAYLRPIVAAIDGRR